MSSTLIEKVDSVLQKSDLLIDKTPPANELSIMYYKLLRFRLGNLKMALLSAIKLGVDLNPASLVKIEDLVHRAHDNLDQTWISIFSSWILKERNFESLWREANKLCVTFLDTLRQQQSGSLTSDQVLEFISFSLENLEKYQDFCKGITEVIRDALKALGDQLIFLRSIILFVIQGNVELGEDLLAHAGGVSVDAAFVLCNDGAYGDVDVTTKICFEERVQEEMLFTILTLVQKIKPIDSQVCKIYTHALSDSKLATRLLPPTDLNKGDESLFATKNFLDSLISVLWEVLGWSFRDMITLKDQLQDFYDGLRSLRKSILKQQQPPPRKHDLKFKENIFNVVCDVGVFICSFQQKNVETDLGFLQGLSETIKIIVADDGEKDPRVSSLFNSRDTTQLAFVDSLLEELMEVKSSIAEPTAKNHAQTIQEELVSLRSVLADIAELRHQDEELQALWGHVLEVAYKVEELIDYLMVGDLPNSVSASFDYIMKRIRNIKLEIKVMRRSEINAKKKAVPLSQSQFKPASPSMTNEVVGFQDEANSILNRLKRGSNKLRIVVIVGMAGLGKTTLAEKVWNDPSAAHHFSVRALTTVSQTFDKRRVLIDLLKQVDPQKCPETTVDDIADQLRRSLKRRRYLILLDDVWEVEAWQCLQESFPDDSMGSRILFTSRHHEVAPPAMLDEKPHELRQFNKEESLDLLQRRLFCGNVWPTDLGALPLQIADICNGLPLTIVIVAGVLKSTPLEDWKTILDNLRSGNLSDRCRDSLELSYRHLPEHLKPCLLYFTAFQEDQDVLVRRLLQLWVAEGFVRKVEMKRQSDVAEEYLKDLIGRSLLLVSKQNFNGIMKACRIHDLLLEFCLQKAKVEQFFHFLEGGHDELSVFNEPRHPWRMCIHSDAKSFLNTKVYCSRVRSMRFMHSEKLLAQEISFIMHICQFLKVLDLDQICIHNLPSQIGGLIRLAYLAVQFEVSPIPPSIGNLFNLETLILTSHSDGPFSLPYSFWNLWKLKHFYAKSYYTFLDFFMVLPMDNLNSSSNLLELDRISQVIIPYLGSMEGIMKKFPNIRKLKCQLYGFRDHGENFDKIVVPGFLSQLESLCLSTNPKNLPRGIRFDFICSPNLKKLVLKRFPLSGRCLSIIGKLPNLEFFKLFLVDLEEKTWIMEEEEFSKLRFLQLFNIDLRVWSGSYYQFGCLEKLKLVSCKKLREMPSCLETISTLQMIEVRFCSASVKELVKNIGEVQVEMGNSDLKVII